MSHTKRHALLLLVVAGGLLMFLAMGLPNLELLPGTPFSLEEPPQDTSRDFSGLMFDDALLAWLLRGGIALMLVLLPFYIIYSLTSRAGRRRLISNIIMMILLLFIANHMTELAQNGAFGNPQGLMSRSNALDEALGPAPVAIFSPDPPQWLTLAVIFIAAVLLVAMAAVVIWIIQQVRKPQSSLEQLAEEAQTAIEALNTGGDFQQTIIRCYHDMSRVIQEERGIARNAAMTPREFEDRLISRGLPGGSIKTLTRLFEQVRYGSLNANPGEEDQAVACLTEIVNYCRTLENRRV
jgi:hypothetical protein